MKKLLAAMFVALLLAGCGEESLDFDDPATLDKIIAEAIDEEELEWKGKYGEELLYAPNQQMPYSGWVKEMYANGQIEGLFHYKDGNLHGLSTWWYESGQKEWERNYKDGIQNGLTVHWYENGQKWREISYKDGIGIVIWYNYVTGTERSLSTYKDGNFVSTKYPD